MKQFQYSILEDSYRAQLTHVTLLHVFATIKKNFRFIRFAYFPERHLGSTEEKIFEYIHKKRFSLENPYIISGGNFGDIYVRNLGIFYNAVLDTRLHTVKDDWQQRQISYAKTVAINLALLSQSKKIYTTYMPVTKNYYASKNLYAMPSDSLFGILYALCAMSEKTFITNIYPSGAKSYFSLQTKEISKRLIKKYKKILQDLVSTYYKEISDSSTGIIRKDIFLASARDGIKRQSSFYDNVIAWATWRFAAQLGLKTENKKYFETWKNKIVNEFWDEKEGIFLDDLSRESKKEKIFSADSFIVLGSTFFNLNNKEDRRKLKKMILYVKKNNLDRPFPLHYAKKNQPKKLYWHIRYFAKSYMGESIWSHWGMEYIKSLILLSKDNPEFLTDVRDHLDMYKKNIEMYGGYPELYNKNGKLFKTFFYKGVLHTSWVVNYEQTKMLFKNAER